MRSVERVETSACDETEKQLSVHAHAKKRAAAKVLLVFFLQNKGCKAPPRLALREVVGSKTIMVSETGCKKDEGVV